MIVKHDQIAVNMGQFQSDLTGLVRNGRLKRLHLAGLSELNDEFFECLFLFPPIVFPASNDLPSQEEASFVTDAAYESIETLELRELNAITGNMVFRFLIDRPNRLREINLHGCKHIGRAEVKRFQYIISLRNLDCKINWT